MRTIRPTLVLAVAVVVLALLAAAAAAMPAPVRPPTVRHATTPVPASALVPKTAAMLPGAAYPWVEPHFVRTGGVTLAILPHAIRLSTMTQPPAAIRIG